MLRNLRDLPGYHLAAGERDIQGWVLTDQTGNKLGEVDSLLVDPELDKEDARGLLPIRYLGVRSGTMSRLVPVGMVDINEARRSVSLTKGAANFADFPEYKAGAAAPAGKEVFLRLFPEAKTHTYERPEFAHEFPHLTLLEERLRVGKRDIQIGEVIAKKRVDEVPVDEKVQLRREHAEIERRPINKPAMEGKIGAGEQEIRMSLMAEEPVVEKVPFAKEEIILHKEVETKEEVIHDKVRREELEFVSTEPELGEEASKLGETRVEKTKREFGKDK
ncbi:Stress response protein YsnF [compost metagenome]